MQQLIELDRSAPPDEALHHPDEIEEVVSTCYQMRTHWDQRLMRAVAEVDRTEFYLRDGYTSTAEWLSNYLGMGFMRAQEYAEVAVALQKLPAMSEAYRCGKLSFDHLRALCQVACPDNEEDLLEATMDLSVSDTFGLVKKITEVSADDALAARGERWLQMRWDQDTRMLLLFAQLPEDQGARVEKAIEVLASKIPDDPSLDYDTPMGVKRADALVELAGAACGSSPKAMVVVHVDKESLASGGGVAEIEDGPNISIETARRLSCDSVVQMVVHDESGKPISVGRARRTVPERTKRELKRRDKTCGWPGCHRTKNLIAHHIDEWAAHKGPTDYDNLVLICEVHHMIVHEGKFKIRGTPPKIWIERPGMPPVKVGPPKFTQETSAMFDYEVAVVSKSVPIPDG